MSHNLPRAQFVEESFPRVSGDEPAAARQRGYDAAFSPRERG